MLDFTRIQLDCDIGSLVVFTVKPVSSCSSQKGSAALGVSWGTAATKKLTTGDFSILVLFNSSQTVAITGIASLLLTICFVLESKKLNIQLQTKSCLLVGYPSSRQLSQSKEQSIVSMMIRRNRFYCCAVFLWWLGWWQWWWWEETNSIVVPCSYVSRLSPNRQYVLCLHSAYFLYWHENNRNMHVCKSNKIFNGFCLWIKTKVYIHCMMTNQ